MRLKKKLWVCYGVSVVVAILTMVLGETTPAYIMAFIAFGFGTIAFLLPD